MTARQTPPFSLLVPVYSGDSAPFLAAALRSSVDEQQTPPDEVVIVQDGPVGANLLAVLEEFEDATAVPVARVGLPVNRGLAHALEAGLDACQHDVVARMDADDISVPERFAVQLERMAAGWELVGTGMLEFSEDRDGAYRTGHLRTPPATPAQIARYARFHDPFNHPTVVYTKDAVSRAGGYQPMGRMEDYWLFARMLHVGVRAANVPLPLVHYRVSSGAYQRRGGRDLLATELRLQRAFRSIGFVSRSQFARNVIVRGGYRLLPEQLRMRLYRGYFTRTG